MARTKTRERPTKPASTKPASTKKTNAGRPEGGGASYVLNQLPDQNSKMTKCPKCGSTSRSAYFGVTRVVFGNRIIVRQRTRCLATTCGQLRIDRHYESLPENQ